MDQLELLRKDWQAQEKTYPHYSKEKITSLLASKSTGITKWLLIIAVVEFVIFAGIDIYYLASKEFMTVVNITGREIYFISVFIRLSVTAWFIYLFWRNYQRISTIQPTRDLMKNILRTHKTMRWYIWFNLVYILVFTMIFAFFMLQNSPELEGMRNSQEYMDHPYQVGAIFIGAVFLFTVVVCAVMYGFYYLIYGLLLRKLNRNYKELKRMELK